MNKINVPEELMSKVEKAYNFAFDKHNGQKDDCGKPYFLHVLQTAQIIEQVTDDEDLICAAYLHDTIEDTKTTYEELTKEFNKEIADLVMEVSHDGSNDNYGYYFPRLKTQNGIMLKFADRLSNISRMESWDIGRREHYLKKSTFWKDGE
jgi:GTP pyrophosphokinase